MRPGEMMHTANSISDHVSSSGCLRLRDNDPSEVRSPDAGSFRRVDDLKQTAPTGHGGRTKRCSERSHRNTEHDEIERSDPAGRRWLITRGDTTTGP